MQNRNPDENTRNTIKMLILKRKNDVKRMIFSWWQSKGENLQIQHQCYQNFNYNWWGAFVHCTLPDLVTSKNARFCREKRERKNEEIRSIVNESQFQQMTLIKWNEDLRVNGKRIDQSAAWTETKTSRKCEKQLRNSIDRAEQTCFQTHNSTDMIYLTCNDIVMAKWWQSDGKVISP